MHCRSITRVGIHKGRYKYQCGCGFFRWEKCGICQEQDVREGHYQDILNSECRNIVIRSCYVIFQGLLWFFFVLILQCLVLLWIPDSRKADSNVSRTSSILCSQNSGFSDSDFGLIINPTPPDDDFDTSSSNSIILPSQEGSEVIQPLNGDEFQSFLTEDASGDNGKRDDHSPAGQCSDILHFYNNSNQQTSVDISSPH